MELKFVKVNPTQNMTILVETPVPRERHGEIAAKLMDYGSVYAEQVGYIEKPADSRAVTRLQMMGGEFCGNASSSTAMLYCLDHGAKTGDHEVITIEASGANGLLDCDINIENSDPAKGTPSAWVTVRMPDVEKIEKRVFKLDGKAYDSVLVTMDGISHIILERSLAGNTPAERHAFGEKAIKVWEDEVKADALGIMQHVKEGNSDVIEPLVYVPGSGTCVWERGCGSGTTATGAWLAWLAKDSVKAEIVQPGGRIKVAADWKNGAVEQVHITGRCLVACRGTAYI
jgi:diaminopimelate epimerase